MPDAGFLQDFLGLLIKEGKRRLLPLTALFTVVALLALAVGLLMPKRWDASTLIIVEPGNVINPLMEGRAVTTRVSDQTALVTQVVLGRKILREVLAFGKMLPPKTSPQEQERVLNELKARIKIESPREETIRIFYNDKDPLQAYRITKKLGEIYIRESMSLKERESREAFDFIDKRVKEYGAKLTDAHQKLLNYYRSQATRPPGSNREPVGAPGGSASPVGRITPEQLASLRVEEVTLRAQLGRKAPEAAAQDTRQSEDQSRARMLQSQAELDRLLATFTEQHPDVRRARRDLVTAKEEVHRAEQARTALEVARAAASALDDDVTRAARGRLEEVQRRIAAATGIRPRAAVPRSATGETIDPEMRGVGQDTTQSELFRRYESTREVYQDLLKRRENARVSMDLDVEHRGFTLRIQEEAEVPVTASSLRLLHQTIVGLLLALAVPLGVLVAMVRFDPRVRSPRQIERLASVPLLVSIPYTQPVRDQSSRNNRDLMVVLMVAGVFVVYAATFVIKLKLSS